jgi:hypothetical protein
MDELKAYPNNESKLPRQLKLFFSISLGIFLFFLFYEPFVLPVLDSNDKMLFFAGLGGITFFFLCLFVIVLPWLLSKNILIRERASFPELILQLCIWITTSIAFTFYIRYVGQIQISMYLVFKIALLNLLPPIILHIDNQQYFHKQQIRLLNERYKKLASLLKNSEGRLKRSETFISENKTEKISLQLDDIILIKSADNYIEIVFREGEGIRHKLIRNTLRNIEAQLAVYTDFVRCHRTCIINMKQADNLFYSYKGYRLSVPDYNEEIPVSRQYIMKIKEVMATL